MLGAMHRQHFWYRGRRRFVLLALRRVLAKLGRLGQPLDVADLGGGNGNWLAWLLRTGGLPLGRAVLADISPQALADAQAIVPQQVETKQVDLCGPLPWHEAFDVVFLLDVIEHFRDDAALLERVRGALRPGGLAVITTPAFMGLWSWNDEADGHFRRYRLGDFRALAERTGLRPVLLRYFGWTLLPLYVAARWLLRPRSAAEVAARAQRLHRVPAAWVNGLLTAAFCAETPLGVHLPLPWGTSALGVLRR